MSSRAPHTRRSTGLCVRLAPLLGICTLFPFCSASAQRLLLKDYSTQDGLPDARIAPIIQDRNGYLWLGAQAGLTRYDGEDFAVISGSRETPGIFGRAIVEDHQQAIWYTSTGFARGGVLRYRRGALTDFSNVLEGTSPVCIAEDGAGRIWIGSDDGLTRITFSDSGRNRFHTDRFPGYRAQALLLDHRGALWIACSAGVVYRYDRESFTRAAEGISGHIRAFAIAEHRGVLWIGSTAGAFAIRDGRVNAYTAADGLPERGVWSFCEDRQGNFWVGTAKGLYRARTVAGNLRFEKDRSFGDGIVYSMLCDAEGNVWFTSHPGLRKLLASDLLAPFPEEEKLSRAGFGPIAEGPDGTIYFGSRNSGVFTLKSGGVQTGRDVRPFTDLTVLSIFPVSATRTWYGIKLGGAILQDGDRTFRYPLKTAGLPQSVHCFARLDDNTLCIGTAAGLIGVGPDNSLRPLRNPVIDTSVVFDLAVTRETLWITTQHGVWMGRVRGDTLSVARPPGAPLLHDGIVYTVRAGAGGTYWFGTENHGLVRLDSSGVRAYGRIDGLAGDRVFALALDSLGLLWAGTATGLSQFDGVRFRSFTGDLGFGEIGLHGLTTDRRGFLWVSSFPGVTRLRPTRFATSPVPPPVYLYGMQADSLRFDPGPGIEVGHDPAVITFRYAGLSYTDETNVRYRYILEGLDEEWSPPVRDRQVRYTHLPPGRYTFRVMARSSDNIWSSEPASLGFVIHPPFYERWWFIAAILIGLGSSLVALYRYRLGRAIQMERTRSRIAMDLHDDIGSSLTRISVMSEVARRQNGTARGETLAKIGTTARELIDALDDIVWSVDPRHDNMMDVIRRIVEFGQQLCEAKGIQFETAIADSSEGEKLDLDRRRDLYLLFKEALANAVRHSGASTVTFRVGREEGCMILELADDGSGLPDRVPSDGNGLRSMRERGIRAGDRFLIHTEPGRGTRLRLEIRTG